ncbi:MAG: M28 family peptidase [Vicinamibacterales bacterium]
MIRVVVALLLIVVVPVAARPTLGAAQSSPARGDRADFHAIVDPVIDTLWTSVDQQAAFGHVEFISQFWRLPGNHGYDVSIDRIRDRLAGTGFTAGADGSAPHVSVEEYPNPGRSWEHSVGTLALVQNGKPDDIVLSRDRERLALCINSFSTDPAGIVAPLVDVGAGRDEDYAGKTLKGAVVIGDSDAGALWREAVVTGGALGVISTALPRYLDADPANAVVRRPRPEWDILQWSSIPYDEARKGFGFKASPRAAARLRQALRDGSGATLSLRITIASQFTTNPIRTLIAEIPGRSRPDERIVIAAHVQEPGANDNASGVATGAELAVALVKAIASGRVPPPGRTLTFLFITEISGSRQWLQSHAAAAKQVKYMFSMDMTGEDVAKTGGTFLIERSPDPGAVWDRSFDPHTEWGRGNVAAASLKGDLINDTHLAVCERVARKSGWVVKTNPYEGGSDHTVFGTAGIPSVLDWHFTDRYYHTNFDTPDKTSPAEMKNVAVAVGATAWLFASANEAAALEVAKVVSEAGRARLAKEEDTTTVLPSATEAVAAWRKWYAEAVRSVSRLVVGPAAPDFDAKVQAMAASFER